MQIPPGVIQTVFVNHFAGCLLSILDHLKGSLRFQIRIADTKLTACEAVSFVFFVQGLFGTNARELSGRLE
jgi:hypothetical protein